MHYESVAVLLSFSFSLVALCFQRHHLLSVLILLEAGILIVTLWVMMMVGHSSSFFLLFMLTPAVCEAALGLALFVLLMRNTGNDLMKGAAYMKW